MELKRFVVTSRADASYVATFYAEYFNEHGNFFISNAIIGTIEMKGNRYDIGDTQGRYDAPLVTAEQANFANVALSMHHEKYMW